MSNAHGLSNDSEPHALTPNSGKVATDSSPSSTSTSQHGDRYDPMLSEEHIGNAVEKPSASQARSSKDIVDFDGPGDPYKPTNWPVAKKVVTTLLCGLTTAGSTWASSIYAPATAQIAKEFGVSELVSTLGLTLFLFGYVLNQISLLGKPSYMLTSGVGWEQDPCSGHHSQRRMVDESLYSRRFSSQGAFASGQLLQRISRLCSSLASSQGSSPQRRSQIQVVSFPEFLICCLKPSDQMLCTGVLGDIWQAEQRGIAILGYSMALVGGPLFSPIAGAAIVHSYLEWRWTFYLTGIMMMTILFFNVIVLDESSHPALLVKKASRLRRETGNWALHAKNEEAGASFDRLFTKFMVRPWQLLFTPICFFMVLYSSFVYGIVYL